MKKVYSYKAPKYQAGGGVPQLTYQNTQDPFPQGGTTEEIQSWYQRNPPQGGTISEAKEDSFMDKVHAFAQNPFTVAKNLYQNQGEWTDGIGGAIDAGTVPREAYDMPLDLINLPGAVSKVSQGVAKGDAGKAAYGVVQSIPYAKTIGTGIKSGMKAVSPYLDDAANAVAQYGDDAVHAYKNVAGKAMPFMDKTMAKYTAKMGVKHAPDAVGNLVANVSPTDLMPAAYAQQPMGPVQAGGNYQMGGLVPINTGISAAAPKAAEFIKNIELDNLIVPQSIQNLVPLNVRQYLLDLMGDTGEINESHLSKGEKEALTKARKKAEKEGKDFIEYGDYDTDSQYGDVGGNNEETTVDLAKRLFDPNYSMKTTFGQMKFKKNDDGTYTYTDQYNFNNAKPGGLEAFQADLDANPDLTTYQKLRKLAQYQGSGPGEGAMVDVTYGYGGKTKPKKYFAGGTVNGRSNNTGGNTGIEEEMKKRGSGNINYGQLGTFASGAAQQYINATGGPYTATDAAVTTGLSMAGQGAQLGSMFGPIGTIAGGLIGGIGGAILGKSQREKQLEEARKKKEAGIDSKINADRANAEVKSAAIMAQYPSQGVKSAGYYAKYGGYIPTEQADYTVEGGEVMMAPNGNPPKTDKHGKATQIGENMFKFTGDTHDAKSGGIGVAGGNTQFATQTNQVLNSGFVFSDRLKTDCGDYFKDI